MPPQMIAAYLAKNTECTVSSREIGTFMKADMRKVKKPQGEKVG